MESLLPSEIARLVYGYLIEEKCEAAAQVFLETSTCLKECLLLKQKGRSFSTSILGLSLVDILNLYTDAVCLVKNYSERKDSLNQELCNFVKELGNVLVLDHNGGRNIAKTVFIRVSIPGKRKLCKNFGTLENIEEEKEEEIEKQSACEPNKNNQNEIDIASNNTSNTNIDDLNMLQALLDNTALHERLAENINKAIDSSGEASNSKTDEKKIVETILHNTETDPIFNELLNELVGPLTEDTTTPEDTDKENGEPSEHKKSSLGTGQSTNDDIETMKKLEEESNLAIEGILAGNKKMLQGNVDVEQQPSKTVFIATPRFVETSSGLYKQSFIIPAGYTVTDVIPASQIQGLATPLEPLKVKSIGTVSHSSPIQTAAVRGRLLSRRRRILPKSEGFSVKIPAPGHNIQEVRVEIPRLPEAMKRSGVRTRGGIQRIGTRGVKAIAPQVSTSVDDNIEIVYETCSTKNLNTSGIKTRAMLRKQNKTLISSVESETVHKDKETIHQDKEAVYKDKETIHQDKETVQLQPNKELQQAEDQENKASLLVEEKTKDEDKEINKATPEQLNLIKKSRVSLSTPRRNHVRVLDFATPVKELVLRKSLTSPKVHHHTRKNINTQKICNVKRGGMFDSPPKENTDGNEKKGNGKKKDWDADLRKFMSVGESMDIPTSVGLKRKNVTKRDRSISVKKKGIKRKLTNKLPLVEKSNDEIKLPEEKKSNEELVDQIEKEVIDIIGEEEMVLNTSQSSELGNLIEQKLLEEMDKNDSFNSAVGDDKSQSESSNHPSYEENLVEKEVLECLVKNVEDRNSKPCEIEEKDDCTNDGGDKEESLHVGINTSTPLKLIMSPVHENSRGQLTPTSKIVMSHLGKSSSRFSSVFSPTSQSSLESILIKECSRMETEKAMSHQSQDIKRLYSPKSDTACSNVNSPSEDRLTNSNNINSNHSNSNNKELTFESVCKNNVSLFETPAKLLSASFPPGTPVEMTPLSRVLKSETNFSSTVLITPTLPPTPKNLSSSITPQKTDDDSFCKINTPGNNPTKSSEEIALNKHQEQLRNKESFKNCPSESGNDTNESPSSFNNSSQNSNRGSIENNKDNETQNKNVEIKSPTNTIVNNVCKTPKIKLTSRKPSRANFEESLPENIEKTSTQQVFDNDKSFSNKLLEVKSKPFFKKKSGNEIEEQEISDTNCLEQSHNNENFERPPQKKSITKQIQSESKKNIFKGKKSSCLDVNKKSAKSSRLNSSKTTPKSTADKEREMEILHILKDTKAKLFGPDDSSDSDSDTSQKCDSELKAGNNIQLITARERLQKLENIKMLNSSSTSNDSSENESVVKQKIIEKDSFPKDDIHSKKISVDSEHSNLEINYAIKKNENYSGLKKVDVTCNSKIVENPTMISKEREESCESFLTLHLSEESNQSLKSDNHILKYSKSKKSPLGGNDSLGEKKNSMLSPASPSKPNEQAARTVENHDTSTVLQSIVENSNTNEIDSTQNITEKPIKDQELHVNEQIFYINETLQSKFSNSSENLNKVGSQAVSNYLDDYVYSFTLNMDQSGNYLTKELRTSSFLNIFEMRKSPILPEYSRKKESSRSDHRSHIRSKSKNRKRPRSASSSEDEKEKRNCNRIYSNHKRERDYNDYRKTGSYDRRNSYSRPKYSTPSHSRYNDFDHFSLYDKKRSRLESPDSKRPSKKDNRRPLEKKLQSNKCDKMSGSYDERYSSLNDSFASSGSEPGGKHTSINSTFSSGRTSESQKDRCSSSSQRLSFVVEDEPFYSRQKPISHRKTSTRAKTTEKEDGELSDSSEIKRISPEDNRSLVLALGAHDSRATLLKKVDLDHFLSIVHGNEK